MNYVLTLQEAAPVADDSDVRSCNVISFASCSICSLSVASIAVCLG